MKISRLKDVFHSLVEFLFPSNVTCMCCGKELFVKNDRYALCDDCSAGLYKIKTCCPRCGKANAYGEVCNICAKTKLYFEKNYACFVYDGLIRNIIFNFKFNDKPYLYKYLSAFMVDKIIEENIECDIITSVPVNKKRYKERGYNQSELLAREISKAIGVQYSSEIYKKENCELQLGKNWNERMENVKNTFFLKTEDAFKDKTVLVVDDIITTGSTLNSVAETMIKNGAKKVVGITLCGVRFKDDPMRAIE